MARKKSAVSEFGLDALRRAAQKTAPRLGNAGAGTKPVPYEPGKGFRMRGGRGS